MDKFERSVNYFFRAGEDGGKFEVRVLFSISGKK